MRAHSSRVNALDGVIRRERVWLDLVTMRFATHPGLRRVFPEYLIGVYHAMHTAGAVMEAARQRCIALASECRVASQLVDYWARHIEDEAGHDKWLVEDLESIGVERSALVAPPLPEVAELLGTLHFWILHTHPLGALAYFYVLERDPPTLSYLDWLVTAAGVQRASLRTFYRHAVIDVEHGRELEELIEALPLTAAHRQLLVLSATTVVHQLARVMERHVRRADALAMRHLAAKR